MDFVVHLWSAALLLLQQHTFLSLVIGGFIGGVFGAIFGGGMFFYTPFFQLMFPSVSFGAIVGNVKVGSFSRGIGSTIATHSMIEYRKTIQVSAIAFVGTILGASMIASLDQRWLFPMTILAIAVSELAPIIAKKITPRTFTIASFFTGLYAGFLGAGISLLLLALFRVKHPEDKDIALVKVQTRFAELLLGVSALVVHWLHGNLHMQIWLPWSIGMCVGGVLGGILLKHISILTPKTQKIILRISCAIAFIVSAWAFF